MDSKHYILKIALPTPLRKIFDYLPPINCDANSIKIGARVKVPFGKREAIGIIIQISDESSCSKEKLKMAIELVDLEPLFTPTILALYNFASKYYQHPIGDIFFSSLPPLLREGASAQPPEDIIFILTQSGASANIESLKHAIQQQKLIILLKSHPNGMSREEINQACGQHKALTALLAKGYIRKVVRKDSVPTAHKATTHCLTLNEYQQNAIDAITRHQGFGTFLLEGVTGSGKTEVYLQCIEHVLKKNKQALVLVPEIGLTPQTVARFQSRFSVPISILHSSLSDKERSNAWILALKGNARIIIGTRSAVLTPLPELGIIILDEEHDVSFKQQSGFRYSAKDLAIMRGKLESVPIILGSATPCLESIFNVKQHRFAHLILPKRAGNASPPHFHIVDVRNKDLLEGFSFTVLERMQEHIKNNGQILIFLNRRGFAPTLLCHHCGWTANCSQCDARLTYHAHLEKLICHHCASIYTLYKRCSACHSSDLLFLGLGTQRLEKILQQHFPGTPIARIDRDSTRRKGSMEKILSTIQAGSSQILIGTQMLAKGHHFPDITMVAIIDMDNCLYSSDFRASERLGQIIVQVAGRAGRSDKPGEVYLQTHNPEHPLLSHLIQSGYSHFANLLLGERKSAQLPPYSHLVLFRAEASDAKLPADFLKEVRHLLLKDDNALQVFGPIPALMEKKAGKFRAQLLVQTKQRSLLQKALHPRIQEIESLPSGRKVRWSLDVDPTEIF
jgi:primosomal protein N' (replication factor Y) (superfamily II helicase)